MSTSPADSNLERALAGVEAWSAETRGSLRDGLFRELRELARSQMRRVGPGQTLQPTALVHEAYLRLAGRDSPEWKSRREFLNVAAQAMHDVLVEAARRKASLKRGGAWRRTDLTNLTLPTDASAESLVALDEALTRLARSEPRKAELVRLRFFVGLSEAETAAALDVSVRTLRRDWRYVRAWMYAELGEFAE